MPLHVLIAGAGLGGLTLAHGLRRHGHRVTVLEQDPGPEARPQGYRIHVDAMGHEALATCLPPELFELYLATSTTPPAAAQAVFFDERFTETRTGDARVGDAAPERAPTAVDRLTLRRILLARLGDVVQFGQRVESVVQDDDGVTVTLTDGRTQRGDLLVGADGIGSLVRQHVVAGATVHDTGVRAITGRSPLADLPGGLPPRLDNSFTGVHGLDHHTLAMAIYRSRRPQPEAAAELAPEVGLDRVEDYLMWLTLARTEDLPIDADELGSLDGPALHAVALELIESWHPQLRALVAAADRASVFPLSIRAVLPLPTWPTGRLTILGDAGHAMAPIGGRGANTAFADAASLTGELSGADDDPHALTAALARYEDGLRERGTAAVVESLRMAGPAIGARSPYAAASLPP